jgi:hypothetical protein
VLVVRKEGRHPVPKSFARRKKGGNGAEGDQSAECSAASLRALSRERRAGANQPQLQRAVQKEPFSVTSTRWRGWGWSLGGGSGGRGAVRAGWALTGQLVAPCPACGRGRISLDTCLTVTRARPGAPAGP